MTFRKLSYYLYSAKVAINVTMLHCTSSSLHIYQTQKVNDWGTEIASMSYVIFEHIKGTNKILADNISCLRSIHLNDPLDPEGEGKDLGQDIFRELHP